MLGLSEYAPDVSLGSENSRLRHDQRIGPSLQPRDFYLDVVALIETNTDFENTATAHLGRGYRNDSSQSYLAASLR
jgi:hypothetical protein